MKKKNESESWYALSGPYDDVIISTRVRIARNLADFPFRAKMTEDDRQRVNTLVYDALSEDESFSYIDFKSVSQPGREILLDKCVIKNRECDAVVLNNNESTSVLVNENDHVRIANFVPGLDCEKVLENAYKIDEYLQKKLQFAASYEFGYLTSHIKDCGTGMKLSIRCFIPSIILAGRMPELVNHIRKSGYNLKPVYKNTDSSGDFANCIFDVVTSTAANGTELDQMAAVQAIGMYILKMERKIRKVFADNNPTIVLNFVKQAYAKGMYSLLLSYEEGVNIFSAIKWGLQTGVLSGVMESEINALYFRTKHGHLKYLCDNYKFTFEKEIKTDEELQIQRLRTIVIQQALENVKFKD